MPTYHDAVVLEIINSPDYPKGEPEHIQAAWIANHLNEAFNDLLPDETGPSVFLAGLSKFIALQTVSRLVNPKDEDAFRLGLAIFLDQVETEATYTFKKMQD